MRGIRHKVVRDIPPDRRIHIGETGVARQPQEPINTQEQGLEYERIRTLISNSAYMREVYQKVCALR